MLLWIGSSENHKKDKNQSYYLVVCHAIKDPSTSFNPSQLTLDVGGHCLLTGNDLLRRNT